MAAAAAVAAAAVVDDDDDGDGDWTAAAATCWLVHLDSAKPDQTGLDLTRRRQQRLPLASAIGRSHVALRQLLCLSKATSLPVPVALIVPVVRFVFSPPAGRASPEHSWRGGWKLLTFRPWGEDTNEAAGER